MDFDDIARRGLVLLGCGKMGSAMLAGWLSRGLPPEAVWVTDPNPSDWLTRQGVHLNEMPAAPPAVALVAVKPQMMRDALPVLEGYAGGETLFVSVAAGTPIRFFEDALGPGTSVVRAMPNTPAAVGRGVTAIVGNAVAGRAALDRAEVLLSAVGKVVRLDSEDQMDAVTAVSGSGPAYVFHMIEALAAAGEAEGLPPALAMELAKGTVAGAGALAEAAEEAPDQLRRNVTSPGGTTEAGLSVLMDEAAGLRPLLRRSVSAAARRSRELRDG